MPKQIVNPPQLAPPRGFNHGIVGDRGRTLFLAGQDASDNTGQIIAPGDVVAQYEQVLKNLQAVVQAAGGQMTDIVKLNIFVSNRDDYVSKLGAIGHIHKQYFGSYYPAMALLEVTGFFQKSALIELEGFAYLE
ncbi:MAG: RidA family protein [Chloroflexi bacterium]|nr:RidA family protein [Chloroflexota bacterium]MBP8060131.1 RidA family protein [Chloroflexota bacterium]